MIKIQLYKHFVELIKKKKVIISASKQYSLLAIHKDKNLLTKIYGCKCRKSSKQYHIKSGNIRQEQCGLSGQNAQLVSKNWTLEEDLRGLNW